MAAEPEPGRFPASKSGPPNTRKQSPIPRRNPADRSDRWSAGPKGLPERSVLLRHALKRPLLPVLAVIGGRLGQLLSGTVIVEILFGWPGVGRLLLSAMQNRDIPVVLGIFLMTSLTVVAANLVIDLLSSRIDPRIGQAKLAS